VVITLRKVSLLLIENPLYSSRYKTLSVFIYIAVMLNDVYCVKALCGTRVVTFFEMFEIMELKVTDDAMGISIMKQT
jgi:hypothetical protein